MAFIEPMHSNKPNITYFDLRPWILIFKVKFHKSYISGMGGSIDMEQKNVSQ